MTVSSGEQFAEFRPERAEILAWLEAFAAAVRAHDFAAARALCNENIFSFCTLAARATGLDELERIQWRHVWPATEGFAFDMAGLQCGGESGLYWIAVTWASQGHKPSVVVGMRHGRATIILRRTGNRLIAIHTHFSLVPRITETGGNDS